MILETTGVQTGALGERFALRVVLVGGEVQHEFSCASIGVEPDPAGAEEVDGGSVEELLEFLERAEAFLDGFEKGAGGLVLGSGGRRLLEHGEEQLVVDVATAVVSESQMVLFGQVLQLIENGLDGEFGDFLQLVAVLGVGEHGLEGDVALVGVRLMMFIVMQAHQLLRENRLKRIVGVGQWRQDQFCLGASAADGDGNEEDRGEHSLSKTTRDLTDQQQRGAKSIRSLG